MMFFRSLLLCCLILVNAHTAMAETTAKGDYYETESLIIDPQFKVPDFSQQWQGYLTRLEKLNQEITDLETRLKAQKGTLKDAMDADPAAMKRRISATADAIRFFRHYKTSISVWRDYFAKNHYGERPKIVAWGLMQQKLRHAKASGLHFMARSFYQGGELRTALNLANLSLKGRLSKPARDKLSREYDLWLSKASLRAGKAEYDLNSQPIGACISFGHRLAEKQPLPLDDYIRAEGGRKLAVSLKGENLCISGLNFGDNFTLTLRRGLMAEDGAVLARDAKRLIKVGDRKASIRFNSDKWLAPITGNEMIAVYSVNLDKAKLSLYRIGERGIQQAMQEGLFSDSMRQYQTEELENRLGEAVWNGTVTLDKKRNEEMTTLIPIRQMLDDMKPGLYILKADWKLEKGQYRWGRNFPLQWILFSDTGLTTVRGNDGLTVLSRSMQTAKAKSGVSLKLVAINNEILGTAKSNRKGIAHFPAGLLRGKGGNQPSHLIADAGNGDFTLLRLGGDSLDLSAFDISGRMVAPEGDLYFFTERSVYRAGEKVYISGFLRDQKARAISNRRLELKLSRPDGTMDRKVMLDGDDLGAYAYDFTLNGDARTGRWYYELSYAGEKTPLASASFEVQDFVPLRLKAELTTASKIAQGKKPLDLSLAADFLYGAPASALGSQIRATLRPASQPFPEYKDYHFGLMNDNFTIRSLMDEKGKLSAEGKQSLSLVVDEDIKTTKPLEIMATATVFDVGGRPANAFLRLPYRHEKVSVGLRMGDIVTSGENGMAEAKLLAVKADGTPIADRKLKARWIREDYDYQWYQRRGYWRSKTVIYDTLIAETDGETDEQGLLDIAHKLPNGAYRLEVQDMDGTSQASIRFHVGWWSQNRTANEPDQLGLKLSTTRLSSGDKLRGQITAPFDGKVTLMVVTDRVHDIRAIDLKDGVADFTLKVNKDWGTGAYLMATAFRPTGKNRAEDAHLPVRATGFAWFDIDHDMRRLNVKLMPPETTLPRKTATIPLKIEGLKVGETARVTLLAVDEGVLRLMAFRSPSLSRHFLGKRALNVGVHDLYGRLLLGEKGRRGTLSTGGDIEEVVMTSGLKMRAAMEPDDNRKGLTTRSRRAVALVARDVTVGANGNAEITLDMPDFVGQLRLMAVAYSTDRMGQDAAPLIVRDEIAADLILPRFMAPGDQAQPVISIQNLSGKSQELTVTLNVDGPVTARLSETTNITLANKERREIPVTLTADGVGTARFTLNVSGAKAPITRTWSMAVRPPYGYESKTTGRMLPPGDSVTLNEGGNPDLQESFIEGSARAAVMLSNAPDLKLDKMLGDLILYRYMCTEQTVSRAMPMLYADRLVKAGLSDKDRQSYAADIDQAIERLLMRQNRGGDFGLWRAYDKGNDWASLYAIDFLMQAQEAGYEVSETALEQAFDWISRKQAGRTPHALMTYGLYLRARAGDAARGDIRHYAVTTLKATHSPLAEAYLGAALALVGENDLAKERFTQALTTEWKYERHNGFYGYGSILRDRAATITLLAESGLGDDLLFEAGSALEKLTAQQTWFNTQQQAWLVRAASVLSGDEALSLTVDGKALTDLKATWRRNVTGNLTVTNKGSNPIRFVETVRGLPAEAPAPVENGARINRRYLDLKGRPVDMDNIRQNDRFIVLITGATNRNGTEASLILDMLPAGLEIENMTVGGDSQLSQYKFLPRLSASRYSSELDDRYFAVLDNRYKRSFAYAYMVRAITPGTYVQPPVMIEDMYQPEYRAVGKAGTVTIHKGTQ